jgi:hypothetical protein
LSAASCFPTINRPEGGVSGNQPGRQKWSMPIRDWKPVLNQFMILYQDRLTEIF